MTKIQITSCTFTNEDCKLTVTRMDPSGVNRYGQTMLSPTSKKTTSRHHRVGKYTILKNEGHGSGWQQEEKALTESQLFSMFPEQTVKNAINDYWNMIVQKNGKAKHSTPEHDTSVYRKEYFNGSRHTPRITNTHYGRPTPFISL